jgi:hypothetical protein
MTARNQSAKEKAFFGNYWNNRIVTMHLQGKTTKEIVKAIGIIKDGAPLSQKHVQWIISRHETFMKLYKSADLTSVRLGNKIEPYYEHEVEYSIKCHVALCRNEKNIVIKPEHLDIDFTAVVKNYKNFVSTD